MRDALEQVARVFIMRVILTPAAYLLPRSWALAVASCSALLLLAVPTPGFDTYWRMRQAFGRSRIASARLAPARSRDPS